VFQSTIAATTKLRLFDRCDGYSGLKALISKKFVGQSDVTDAIEKLQAHSHFGRLDIILNSSRVRT
jgi:hypothetical protein